MKKIIGTVVVIALAVAIWGSVYISLGSYDVGADVPHNAFTYWLLDTARDRSVETRAAAITVPGNLGDQSQIEAGAGLYAEMCADCHLAPGMEKTEISQGLYPRAPELYRGTDLTPAEEFWIIKHGIKMSGMAAWGKTHDDMLIWQMVAFLGKLPSLSAEQYKTMTANAPEEHEESMEGQSGAHQH